MKNSSSRFKASWLLAPLLLAAAGLAFVNPWATLACLLLALLILFWPAIFFVGGDKGSAAEVGRLKGEMQAIEQANLAKSCGIQFQQG